MLRTDVVELLLHLCGDVLLDGERAARLAAAPTYSPQLNRHPPDGVAAGLELRPQVHEAAEGGLGNIPEVPCQLLDQPHDVAAPKECSRAVSVSATGGVVHNRHGAGRLLHGTATMLARVEGGGGEGKDGMEGEGERG